jgi:hypothetical protein
MKAFLEAGEHAPKKDLIHAENVLYPSREYYRHHESDLDFGLLGVFFFVFITNGNSESYKSSKMTRLQPTLIHSPVTTRVPG